MSWELIITLNVAFAVLVALLWTACFGSKKVKLRKGEIRHRHDAFEINPDDIPQFEPTWRNAH